MQKNLLLVIVLFSVSNVFAQEKGSFEDMRDGNWYKYVTIGSKVWMAESVNYKTAEGSWCYGEGRYAEEKCKEYGRLYNHNTAKNVCPNGWRLPDKADYELLIAIWGGTLNSAAGGAKDPKGFNAKLGGFRGAGGAYDFMESAVYFWTSTKYGENSAWMFGVAGTTANAMGSVSQDNIHTGRYVRCIKK